MMLYFGGKIMAQLWGGRFTKETDQMVYDFNASILFKNSVFKDVLEFCNNTVKFNTKAEVSFKVDKKIEESELFSGIQIANCKFGCETSFFGRDFGLVGFLSLILGLGLLVNFVVQAAQDKKETKK